MFTPFSIQNINNQEVIQKRGDEKIVYLKNFERGIPYFYVSLARIVRTRSPNFFWAEKF